MPEKEEYPELFYRGISSKGFLDSSGHPNISTFVFDDVGRNDLFREMSVNWNDSSESLDVLLGQKKENGCIQFVGGAISFELSKIREILYPLIVDKKFHYERRPLENNKFHGNLLLKYDPNDKAESKQSDSLVRNFLVLMGKHQSVIPNYNVESDQSD